MKNHKTMNILIIDDEPDIVNLLSKILSREGYCVDTARSGEEGISKIEFKNYGLIIADIKMPGISGDQVCHHIKCTNDPTPVVGMSGTPWLLDGYLFDAVLEKPFLKKQLLLVIKDLMPD